MNFRETVFRKRMLPGHECLKGTGSQSKIDSTFKKTRRSSGKIFYLQPFPRTRFAQTRGTGLYIILPGASSCFYKSFIYFSLRACALSSRGGRQINLCENGFRKIPKAVRWHGKGGARAGRNFTETRCSACFFQFKLLYWLYFLLDCIWMTDV